MGPLLVIGDHPPVGCLPDLSQVAEQIQVKQFVPVRPVEALDVSVLVRLTGLDVLDQHSDRLGPGDKLAAQELGTIIDSQHFGKPSIQA